jgi:hypothetical protein
MNPCAINVTEYTPSPAKEKRKKKHSACTVRNNTYPKEVGNRFTEIINIANQDI